MDLTPLPAFDIADIENVVSAPAFDRGMDYALDGRVSPLSLSANGMTLKAEVLGSAETFYDVVVYFATRHDKRLSVVGTCACPVGTNCKHVAAVLITAVRARTCVAAKAAAPVPADDPRLTLWIEAMREALPKPSAPEAAGDEHVAYVFAASSRTSHSCFPMEIVVVRRTKAERWAQVRTMTAETLVTSNARAVRPDDRTIAHLLRIVETRREGRHDLIEPAMQRIIATGRAHAGSVDAPPLALGPTRTARLAWSTAEDGRQRPLLAFDDPNTAPIADDIVWYVDRAANLTGPIDAGLPSRVVAAFLAAPTLSPALAERARAMLPTALPDLALPPPAEVRERTKRAKPVPILTLRTITVPAWRERWNEIPETTIDIALLRFRYGETIVDPMAPDTAIRTLEKGVLTSYERTVEPERKHLKTLAKYGFSNDIETRRRLGLHGLVLQLHGSDARFWPAFLHGEVPRLRAKGWELEIEPSFRPRVVDLADDEVWRPEVHEREHGWFDLAIGLDVAGERYDLLPILRELAQRGAHYDKLMETLDAVPTFYVSVGNGNSLAFPAVRLKAILGTLVELGDPSELTATGPLRYALPRAGILKQLEAGSALRWDVPERIRALGERLQSFSGLTRVPVPKTFRGELRDYQRDGLDWLQFLATNELGGILADDMGLGKSVQTLAHLLREKASRRLTQPALLVVPTSLVYNWCDEAARFAPSLRVLSLHGTARAQRFADIADHDLVITTYALLVRDAALHERTWHAVILDEAQALKNPAAKAAQVAMTLRSSHRVCLTGTPVENSLGDLWSLLSIALPGALGERKQFGRLFRTPIEKHGDTERSRVLAERIRPFVLRRTKEAVAKELPEKTEIVQRVELLGAQRDVYETIRLAMHARVQAEIAKNGIARSQIVILDALLKLRQVCCDPRLLPERMRTKADSAKLDLLLEMLPQMVAEGRRILLFSQFTSMLDLIAPALAERAIPFVTLTGQTNDRKSAVDAFQNGNVPVFLISLKAGGTGLNLTAADTVIHYDPWWNPAVERQATDRAHRIGQQQHVFVYKLIGAGTVEEKIVALQSRKAELAAAIYDGDGASGARFGAEDIERFFAPLGE